MHLLQAEKRHRIQTVNIHSRNMKASLRELNELLQWNKLEKAHVFVHNNENILGEFEGEKWCHRYLYLYSILIHKCECNSVYYLFTHKPLNKDGGKIWLGD